MMQHINHINERVSKGFELKTEKNNHCYFQIIFLRRSFCRTCRLERPTTQALMFFLCYFDTFFAALKLQNKNSSEVYKDFLFSLNSCREF